MRELNEKIESRLGDVNGYENTRMEVGYHGDSSRSRRVGFGPGDYFVPIDFLDSRFEVRDGELVRYWLVWPEASLSSFSKDFLAKPFKAHEIFFVISRHLEIEFQF